jgi:hypothetical protein
MARNPLVVVTLAGLIVYASVRNSYTIFFRRFGLEPEDVGLSYTEILNRTAVILAVLVVVSAVPALATAALWVIFSRGDRPVLYGALTVITAVFALSALFIVTWGLRDSAITLRNAVSRGEPGPETAQLGLRVRPVEIAWVGDAPAGLGDLASHRLMLLGETGGTTILYDADASRTIRIPSGEVVVSTLLGEPNGAGSSGDR